MKEERKKEPMNPIEFVENAKGFVESPIEFVTKPIAFIAKQQDETGKLTEIELDNSLLAGHVIPAGFTVVEYENAYCKMLAELQNRSQQESVSPNTKKASKESPVIRPRSEITELTNYELKPLCRRFFMNKEGDVDYTRNEIVVEITINEKFSARRERFTIKNVDIEKITKIVGKNFPSAIIYDKGESSKVENDFREKTAQIPITTCYTDAGWQVIVGKHVYLHRESKLLNAEIMTPLSLPVYKDYQKRDLENVWRMALGIYKAYEVASVLCVYSFLGVSYKLFDEAGFAPHFLLFINGKTGSLKTTVSKIFYTQLTEEKYRDFPRRIDVDTQTSFERALVVSGRDTVTLIDDYSPAKSIQKKSEMANNLESIIRMVGDGSTKSRSNVELKDCRGEGVKGMVVLTGELRGKGLSSNLRCLYCELERENVNLEVVSWFQTNKYAYTTLLEHFTRFLSDNWLEVVSYIKERIEANRRKAEIYLSERRLVDTLATLWIMAEIISNFLASSCGMRESEASSLMSLICDDMVSVVVRSEMISKEESPALVFMRAFVSMLASKKIRISPTHLQEIELNVLDGFEDEQYIYLLPDNVYQKVTAWLKMGGLYFGTEMNQLGSILCNEGYAVTTTNGANKKLYYARIDVGHGRKVKFLKIPKAVIRQLQENTEQEG